MADELSAKDGLDLYETGKHRRYSLLFSVNGGAFAIARLLVDTATDSRVVLGGLTLARLSLGMILFTAVMVYDIFMFGIRMRTILDRPGRPDVFGMPGKLVLLLLGLLIATGWFFVGFSGRPLP
jgi:hypothetical protein